MLTDKESKEFEESKEGKTDPFSYPRFLGLLALLGFLGAAVSRVTLSRVTCPSDNVTPGA